MRKILLPLFLIIILVGCKTIVKDIDYTEDYQNLEATFLEAAERFVSYNEHLIPEDGTHYSIKLDNLYVGDYLKDFLIDPESNEECNKERSFVHVRLIDEEYNYVVFLECGKYMTGLEE